MSVSAIIVTYQPDISIVTDLILEISSSLDQIIIIDNASSNIEELREAFCNIEKVKLIELIKNVGIATAQNIGIKRLSVSDDELIIFFDQDSFITSNSIRELQREYEFLENKCNSPIILGPVFFHRTQGFEYPCVKFDKFGFREKIFPSNFNECVEVSCIISSGMCVRKKLFNTVGYMRDELFIDYVDTEWCMRAIYYGCRVFVSPSVHMDHEIGTNNVKLFKWQVPVHTPNRRYFRIRNSFILRQYSYLPKIFILREIFFSIIHQIILIIFIKEKIPFIKSLIKGIGDGLSK